MFQEKPIVSVVMPLYNKGAEVRRAIGSVLRQSVSRFELIVVNDGSTDDGPDIVRELRDDRITLIDQKNAGVSAARNRGIRKARTDLVTFLDADDEWLSTFLQTIVQLRRRWPSCDVFATNYLYRDIDGTYRFPIIRGLPSSEWQGVLDDYFAVAARSDPPIWSSAVAVTRKAIESVDLFPVGVSSGEDLLTWARLGVRYEIAYTTEVHAVFWKPLIPLDNPKRIPVSPDTVGRELSALILEAKPDQAKAIGQYVSLWHRMRCAMMLRTGNREGALRAIRNSLRFSKCNLQAYFYLILALMPKSQIWAAKEVLDILRRRRRLVAKLEPKG